MPRSNIQVPVRILSIFENDVSEINLVGARLGEHIYFSIKVGLHVFEKIQEYHAKLEGDC
jgi:hypothetical protein